MQITQRKTETLKPYEKNARTHSPAQVKQIAASITEFGFNVPILIDDAGQIIAGHGRLMAANHLGLKTVPCIEINHLSEAQRRAYIIADNKLALNAGWDDDRLVFELGWLKDAEFNLDLIGFDQKELNDLMGKPIALADEEDIPEPPVTPKSRLGDILLLGDHRVMCGDSTDKASVEKLLGGGKPHLMVTDPPYGVEYDATWRDGMVDPATGKAKTIHAAGKVLNDDRASWREAYALFPGNIAYVWHASQRCMEVGNDLIACGYKIRNQIIWNKNQMCIGRGDYHWKHEPCWYAVRGTGKWTGDRKQTTVWDIDKPQKSETGHSTQKPVECMRRPMINNSAKGDAVYDPFLGSGTTVIAAETEGRVCYGMELSPVYVDVIVNRWQNFTGKKAIHAATGEPFNG